MRKVIYTCDKCGFETEDTSKISFLKLFDMDEEFFHYYKMLCPECCEEVKKLIDENLLVSKDHKI